MDGTGQDFERWRARGDVDALARVFDAQAPKLLRFAVHLVGDANAAEDLVQESFLTALRRASEYDVARPIDRWLAGILVRHAQEMRREARRFTSQEWTERLDEDTPFEAASRRELSGELARAVDALAEPYRAAILLSLRHGLEPADIAHVLGRSPGAVRVQLHRAREMLRKSLPAGVASALVILAEPARGLGSVRNQVLEHAARLAPAASIGGGLLGGVLVMKKLVVALAVLVVGLVAFLAWSRGEPVQPDGSSIAAAAPALSPSPAAEVVTVEPVTERARIAEVAESDSTNAKAQEVLRGIVLDADTNAPVAGARIALFAPIEMTVRELRTRYWDRLSTSEFGVEPSRPWPHYDTPQPTGITPELRPGFETIRVHAPPPEGAAPFVETTSGPDGRFELRADTTDAFLTCDADGYAQRAFATRADRLGFAESADRTIYVARNRKLRGRIVDVGNQPIRASIALSLYGHAPKQLYRPGDPYIDPQDRRVLFRTDDEGHFELDVDACFGFIHSADARWRVTQHGHLRPDGITVRETPWFDLVDETGDVQLTLAGVCSILVRDAETREPIEDAYLTLTVTSSGLPLRQGWFHLEDGRFAIAPAMVHEHYAPEQVEKLRVETVARVWTPGYVASSKPIADLFAPDTHEIDLHRDTGPGVVGRVRRGLVGAHDARVLAYSTQDGVTQRIAWREPLAGGRTDEAGSFELVLPPGRYVLDIEHENDHVRRALDVPGDAVDVDLDATATLLVRLTRADGTPSTSRAVRVRDRAGIETRATTDGTGVARIQSLPAGLHDVSVSHRPGQENFRAGETRAIDLVAGTNEVEFAVPGAHPMYARLVVEDGPVAGWSVQPNDRSPGSARPVETSGRIPLDFSESRYFVLTAPHGLRHAISLSSDAQDGVEVRVQAGGLGYRGRLVDAASGSFLSGVDLWFASESSGTRRTCMVTTDAEGRFEARGLAADAIRAQTVRQGVSPDEFGSVTFEFAAPPSDPPIEVVLRRPRFVDSMYEGFAVAHLEGRFTSDASAVLGRTAFVSAIVRGDAYSTWMSQSARVGSDGAFRVRIPAAGERNLSLSGGDPFRRLMTERWIPSGAEPEVREFTLPP